MKLLGLIPLLHCNYYIITAVDCSNFMCLLFILVLLQPRLLLNFGPTVVAKMFWTLFMFPIITSIKYTAPSPHRTKLGSKSQNISHRPSTLISIYLFRRGVKKDDLDEHLLSLIFKLYKEMVI